MGNLFPFPFSRQPWNGLVNATSTHCGDEKYHGHIGDIAVLSTAAAIIIFLNLLKWLCRKPLSKFPGVIIPVNLLETTRFRLIYCLIMALWAGDVTQDLFIHHDLYYRSPDNGIIDAIKFFVVSPTVIILRQALIYFPVLACVDSPLPLVGHYLGFIYTLLMGGRSVFRESVVLRGCSYRLQLSDTDIGISLAINVPVYLGYLLVAYWYFKCAAMETSLVLFRKRSLYSNMSQYTQLSNYKHYVRQLLKRSPRTTGNNNYRRIRRSLRSYLFQGLQYVLPFKLVLNFQLPFPFLVALCMTWTTLYQLCIQLIAHEVKLVNNFITFVDSFNITVSEIERFFPNWSHELNNIFYDFRSFSLAMLIILPFGTAIGLGLCIFFTMYMVLGVHKHMVRASRGDLSFLLASEPLPSKAYILAASMKYSAFQMAYSVFSWLVYSFFECALMALGLMFYYLFKNMSFKAIHIWSWFMIPMMWAAGLHYLQLSLCRYVFLVRDNGELVTVRFKNVYQVLTYVLFFFNFIFAIVMSVLRVYTSFMFTMVMYMRLDWDVYMRGLEGWDFGHRTYVGYVYMEYTHNNIVLRSFVHLLLDAVATKKKRCQTNESHERSDRSHETSPDKVQYSVQNDSLGENERISLLGGKESDGINYNSMPHKSVQVKRRARNRWLVAYTLLRNPGLQKNLI